MARYQGHPGNVGLDALRRELVDRPKVGIVDRIAHEDVPEVRPQLVRTRKENRARRYTGAEDHAHDLASTDCACTKTTMCALHAHLVDRRWHARP